MLITKKNICISTKDGEQIPAIYEPGEEDKVTVVMAHGLQGSKNEYLDTQARIAEKLQEYGIGSLRIDFCGHGDSKRSLKNFSLTSQVDDLKESIKWLIDNKGIVSIIMLGISFGAPPAILVSELFKDVIKKCVLIAPVVDYKKTFVYPQTQWSSDFWGYEHIIQGICNDGLELDENYVLTGNVLLEILTVDIPGFIKETTIEITIFHGKGDNMVPLTASEDVSKSRDNINLIKLEDTEHGLTEIGDCSFESEITKINLAKVVDEIMKGEIQ